jgi:putative transposase
VALRIRRPPSTQSVGITRVPNESGVIRNESARTLSHNGEAVQTSKAGSGLPVNGRVGTEADIEIILERAKELHPEARPRIISDNGPQFIAKDFKEFIRISGMSNVRTSPYYPQSNGKIERWHKSLKGECIRPGTPLSLEDARRLVECYVEHYNNVRLNSAVGYITPKDMLAGRQQEIHAERDRKLEAARKQRQIRQQQAA